MSTRAVSEGAIVAEGFDDVGLQRGLVVLHHAQVVPVPVPGLPAYLALREDPVAGDDRAFEGQPIQKEQGRADLVGVGGHHQVADHRAQVRRKRGQHMDGLGVEPTAALERLAADGDVAGRGPFERPPPKRQGQRVAVKGVKEIMKRRMSGRPAPHDVKKRMCLEPTDEDRAWFPGVAGNPDYMGVLRQAWADFRDESFILQYLSPQVMRDFRLFHLKDKGDNPAIRVEAIHDASGYRQVRRTLARQYDVSAQDPDIQVTDADLSGSRRLVLTHFVRDGILLDKDECDRTLMHVARLWGYRVRLVEVDSVTNKKLREHETLPLP